MTLLILALAILHQPGQVTHRCDLIELNHLYNDKGEPCYPQVIFWDRSHANAKFNVRSWRLCKTEHQRPRRMYPCGDWVSLWTDGGNLIEVRAPSFRETWTQYDPELHDRDSLPKERRREFVKPQALE